MPASAPPSPTSPTSWRSAVPPPPSLLLRPLHPLLLVRATHQSLRGLRRAGARFPSTGYRRWRTREQRWTGRPPPAGAAGSWGLQAGRGERQRALPALVSMAWQQEKGNRADLARQTGGVSARRAQQPALPAARSTSRRRRPPAPGWQVPVAAFACRMSSLEYSPGSTPTFKGKRGPVMRAASKAS